MKIVRCKMCAGSLVMLKEPNIAQCEYCSTVQTVPIADDEKKISLFNRANRLRYNCEFDKALMIYESIIAEFPEEAEAYWGVVLCKYGIEYVDDPITAKKIPTCHRSSFDSIMDDSDFEQALENSDVLTRKIYREEAKVIERIRKRIIEISLREESYDIFICYKETDYNGNRTLDSVLAQDIYESLIEKGYKVFFSRITLEDKLGEEYEPYIFAALNSAKIMLAIGTDYEHFNSVWVKNEWGRFLKMISSGEKKTLIPCYKDIDIDDMPKEFVRLQSQDLNKVGATQDILRGIAKILNKTRGADNSIREVAQETVKTIELEKTKKQVENLVTLGVLAIDSGDLKEATNHFEEALKLDSECIGAYLGIIRTINNSIKVVPYIEKLKTLPIENILEYIKSHKNIIGDSKNENNLLTIAAWAIKSSELICGLLEMGCDANSKNALIQYVDKCSDEVVVKTMIDYGADINAIIWWRYNYKIDEYNYISYDCEKHNVLSTAIKTGKNKKIIELLINAGANVNHTVQIYHYWYKRGEKSEGDFVKEVSPLTMAMLKNKNMEVLRLLIDAGANVNYLVANGKEVDTFLGMAISKRNYELTKLLLDNGANPNEKRINLRNYNEYDYEYINEVNSSWQTEEYSPISDSIWRAKDINILELLIERCGNVNAYDNRVIVRRSKDGKYVWKKGISKSNPLIDAICYTDDEEIVEKLLDKGAYPNAKYYYKGYRKDGVYEVDYETEIPVLAIAVIKQKKKIVKMLLDAGASFSDSVVYKERSAYDSKKWYEDKFLLSEYSFSDKIVEEMGELIRQYGWKDKSSKGIWGFFEKRHVSFFKW